MQTEALGASCRSLSTSKEKAKVGNIPRLDFKIYMERSLSTLWPSKSICSYSRSMTCCNTSRHSARGGRGQYGRRNQGSGKPEIRNERQICDRVVERKEQIEIKEQEVKWKEGELNATTVRLPAEAEIHRRRKEDSGGKECSDREREDQDNMHGRSLGVRQHRQCRHGETEAGSRRLRAVRGRCHYDPTSGGSSKDCHRSGRFPCQDR